MEEFYRLLGLSSAAMGRKSSQAVMMEEPNKPSPKISQSANGIHNSNNGTIENKTKEDNRIVENRKKETIQQQNGKNTCPQQVDENLKNLQNGNTDNSKVSNGHIEGDVPGSQNGNPPIAINPPSRDSSPNTKSQNGDSHNIKEEGDNLPKDSLKAPPNQLLKSNLKQSEPKNHHGSSVTTKSKTVTICPAENHKDSKDGLTENNNGEIKYEKEKKVTILENGGPKKPRDRGLPRKISMTTENMCRLKNMTTNNETIDTLHISAERQHCSGTRCLGSVVQPSGGLGTEMLAPGELRSQDELLRQAKDFISQYYKSLKRENIEEEMEERWERVKKEIELRGTYDLDEKELVFGARLAWRNAARCIGRIQWKKLQVFDFRHVTTAKEMFDCILQHLQFATNKGKIRSTISIFPHKTEDMKEFRVWNSQIIRYAGYKKIDGTIVGDPASVEFTEIAQNLGWKGAGTQFDVLPLILQATGRKPEWFEIPKEYVMEVQIKHPNYPKLDELGLKWYAVPAVSNIMLDCGGLQFTACPFNGWYMATEVGARNFTDTNRYNLLKQVAQKMGLNTINNSSMWKDRVQLELTFATLNSYTEAGVTIVDHHTASESFMKHMKDEEKVRGGCPADWVWIVPPISGSVTPVFHQEMLNYKLYPSYEYLEDAWKYLRVERPSPLKKRRTFKDVVKIVELSNSLFGGILKRRSKVSILYATETGKSKAFANLLNEVFLHGFDSKVYCMQDYRVTDIENEQCVLFVASTFGNGEPPDNGQDFVKGLHQMIYPTESMKKYRSFSNLHQGLNEIPENQKGLLCNLRYSVFGLGSRAYPKFCEFGHLLDNSFAKLGGEQIYPMGEGDELNGQEESFKDWARACFKAACDVFVIKDAKLPASIMDNPKEWKDGCFRIKKHDKKTERTSICDELRVMHGRKVFPCPIIDVQNLQTKHSDRVTNLVQISSEGEEGMMYQPGDHLYIYPENDSKRVDKLLKRIRCETDMDELVMVEQTSRNDIWDAIDKVPLPNTLRRIFTNYLDIESPPSRKLLGFFALCAKDEDEKTKLNDLATVIETYDDWRLQDYPSVLEVLNQFKSIDVDVTLLIDQLPLQKARPYSISSSPKMHPNQIHVTVAFVSYKVKDNVTHLGVCSSYLNNRRKGDIVPCYVKRAYSFYLPEDKSAPIMLVGPGTGIAPFRSFWQENICENRENEIILYFGCRHPLKDNIYKQEMNEALAKKGLTKLHVAYSRQEFKPKVYVQDLLRQNAEEVCNFLVGESSHFYVCGDVTMASDVFQCLLDILQKHSAFSQSEAEALIADMKKAGRYHEDIFGVTLKVREVTTRVRSAVKRRSLNLKNQRPRRFHKKLSKAQSLNVGAETARRSQTFDLNL
ncbi:nitric oxide synthase, inducible-like [Clytia hemisphaerica]|uniref:nitric oxide synthase, inducible-like n=1 Tax=Clytia hemisphaerica TaxID=252671 RepID=UPI0034D48A33